MQLQVAELPATRRPASTGRQTARSRLNAHDDAAADGRVAATHCHGRRGGRKASSYSGDVELHQYNLCVRRVRLRFRLGGNPSQVKCCSVAINLLQVVVRIVFFFLRTSFVIVI
ncbi:unnamed protein product [Ceratitis capitata]|uniref:(Mediterranean fruit fly) hypothetical protein n=1 Tax=Ceratitis capitata TaxID=7213 RepID=A0A811UGF1_CERCA|nr:unnamed protein product [Ceratitis capitata]